jgi:hypothetical protein
MFSREYRAKTSMKSMTRLKKTRASLAESPFGTT